MGFNIKADLGQCRVAFLTPIGRPGGGIDQSTIVVADGLRERGVKCVRVVDMEKATAELAKIQNRHGRIPSGISFLKITDSQTVVNMFC